MILSFNNPRSPVVILPSDLPHQILVLLDLHMNYPSWGTIQCLDAPRQIGFVVPTEQIEGETGVFLLKPYQKADTDDKTTQWDFEVRSRIQCSGQVNLERILLLTLNQNRGEWSLQIRQNREDNLESLAEVVVPKFDPESALVPGSFSKKTRGGVWELLLSPLLK